MNGNEVVITITSDKPEDIATGVRLTARISCRLPSGQVALGVVRGIGLDQVAARKNMCESAGPTLKANFIGAVHELFPEPKADPIPKAKAPAKGGRAKAK